MHTMIQASRVSRFFMDCGSCIRAIYICRYIFVCMCAAEIQAQPRPSFIMACNAATVTVVFCYRLQASVVKEDLK